ncbi:MAG TPA: branched-chain amino acid ABC transporter substrate-binding protein [Caldilineaceae bacterium]|nr:branched-chain amino acid ABC transporter substrate-binding protein [Caldilineaceae bacterium]
MKTQVLMPALLLAVSLVAVLGMVASPAIQPQQASTLVERVAALETAVADHATANQALSTRVARLEEELGLAGSATPETTSIDTTDWQQATSQSGEFTYKHPPDWVVFEDNEDGLFIDLPRSAQVLYFFWYSSAAFLDELIEDEEARQEFAATFWQDVENIEVLSTAVRQFNGASAVFWDSVRQNDDGYYIREYFVFYPCGDDGSCILILGQYGATRAMTPEDWSLLEAFANEVHFIAGPTTRQSTWTRECPSTDCEAVELLPRGQHLDLIGQSEDGVWYQLASGEWLAAAAVENAPADLPVATANDSPRVVKLATQSPLSGPQSVLGVAIKNGAELAIEQLGGKLEDKGVTLELVSFDDQATPDIGVANAREIVADPQILCVVGHLNSGVMLPSMEEYHHAGLAAVSPANTNPLITDRGYPEINRVIGRDDVQGIVAQRFAAEYLGVQSVYIIHDKSAYGQGIAERLRQSAEDAGIVVVDFVGAEEQTDFSGLVSLILAAEPDLVYFAGIYSQAGPFFSQARAAGVTSYFMGPDGMDSSELASLAGDGAVGLFYSALAGPASVYPDAEQFIRDYETTFGEPPQPFAAQAYDAMGICIDGIARAMEANGGRLPSRAQVAGAVRATEDYPGVTGTITLNAYGDRASATYFVLEVRSSDPDLWRQNEIITTLQVESPNASSR